MSVELRNIYGFAACFMIPWNTPKFVSSP